MTYYKYDIVNGKLKGVHTPQVDPLESKKAERTIYMLPTNITEIEPPEPQDGVDYYFKKGEWTTGNKITVYDITTCVPIEVVDDDFDRAEYMTETPITVYEKSTLQEIKTFPSIYDRDDFTEKIPPKIEKYVKWDGDDWIEDVTEKREHDILLKEAEILRRMAIDELDSEEL